MLAGRLRHRDNAGHEGLPTAGAVQWMTAGRGIAHSGLPGQEDGLMRGFPLWVNLPARDKMTAPDDRGIQPFRRFWFPSLSGRGTGGEGVVATHEITVRGTTS